MNFAFNKKLTALAFLAALCLTVTFVYLDNMKNKTDLEVYRGATQDTIKISQFCASDLVLKDNYNDIEKVLSCGSCYHQHYKEYV